MVKENPRGFISAIWKRNPTEYKQKCCFLTILHPKDLIRKAVKLWHRVFGGFALKALIKHYTNMECVFSECVCPWLSLASGPPEPRPIKHLKINSVPTVWSVLSCGQPFSHASCSAIFSTPPQKSSPALSWVCEEVCAGPRARYDLRKPSKYVCVIYGVLHSEKSTAIACSRTHTCTVGAFEMNRWDWVCVKGRSWMQRFYPPAVTGPPTRAHPELLLCPT